VVVFVSLLNDQNRSFCSSNQAIEYAWLEQPTQPVAGLRRHRDEVDVALVGLREDLASRGVVSPDDAGTQVRQLGAPGFRDFVQVSYWVVLQFARFVAGAAIAAGKCSGRLNHPK
jgi:hypothetical protein